MKERKEEIKEYCEYLAIYGHLAKIRKSCLVFSSGLIFVTLKESYFFYNTVFDFLKYFMLIVNSLQSLTNVMQQHHF